MKPARDITVSSELAAQYTEPNQANRFDSAVRKVLAYPRAAMLEREAEHRREAALNPHRRGPKPKSASSVPHAELRA